MAAPGVRAAVHGCSSDAQGCDEQRCADDRTSGVVRFGPPVTHVDWTSIASSFGSDWLADQPGDTFDVVGQGEKIEGAQRRQFVAVLVEEGQIAGQFTK